MTEEKTKSEQVLDLLNEQVVEQTLSLQGIEKVKDILAENDTMAKKIKMLENAVEENNKENSGLRNDNSGLRSELEKVTKRNTELEEKERIYLEQSIRFAYESKRGDEMKEIVGLALRNPIITKSRFESGNVPIAIDGGNGCMGTVLQNQQTTSSITETVEEK